MKPLSRPIIKPESGKNKRKRSFSDEDDQALMGHFEKGKLYKAKTSGILWTECFPKGKQFGYVQVGNPVLFLKENLLRHRTTKKAFIWKMMIVGELIGWACIDLEPFTEAEIT